MFLPGNLILFGSSQVSTQFQYHCFVSETGDRGLSLLAFLTFRCHVDWKEWQGKKIREKIVFFPFLFSVIENAKKETGNNGKYRQTSITIPRFQSMSHYIENYVFRAQCGGLWVRFVLDSGWNFFGVRLELVKKGLLAKPLNYNICWFYLFSISIILST